MNVPPGASMSFFDVTLTTAGISFEPAGTSLIGAANAVELRANTAAAPNTILLRFLGNIAIFLQILARTDCYTGQRIIRDTRRNLSRLRDEFVQTLEQRRPTSQDDAALNNIRRQLGGRLLQTALDLRDDLGDRLDHAFAHFLRRYRDRLRKATDEVSTAHFHRHLIALRHRAADHDLDLFRGTVADHQVVLRQDVAGDDFVELP